MSTQKDERPADGHDDPKKTEERRDESEPRGQGKDYVFKIAPADPKNAFDFEDVADK